MGRWAFNFTMGLLIAVTFAQNANAGFKIGQWVLTRYQGAAYYFPGVVVGINGNNVTTQYDDGDVETRPSHDVKPYDWHPGTRVECNFQGAGTWYPGAISAMQGDTGLSISYDDGDREDTITGLCRSR